MLLSDKQLQVRLSDVYPTGEARLVQDSAIRMRWREGGQTPLSMAPGEVYAARLSLWNTSYVVAPGHALRFSISSSNFPRFDVNPNNGILLGSQSISDVNYSATNTLYHSAQYPSRVTLPVVTRRDLPEVRNIAVEARKAYPGVHFESIAASKCSCMVCCLSQKVIIVLVVFRVSGPNRKPSGPPQAEVEKFLGKRGYSRK
jgi:hypothetical protein